MVKAMSAILGDTGSSPSKGISFSSVKLSVYCPSLTDSSKYIIIVVVIILLLLK